MWLVNPALLCDKHLLGEHGELHKFRHCFVKKQNMSTRINLGQIQVADMDSRHDELATEMLNRGFNHNSPYEMPDISYIPENLRTKKVNFNHNITDLINRCEKCRNKIKGR
jgi:hypothetical protein